MKKYTFKLEKVLDYRKDIEKITKQELANVQKKLQEEEERMNYYKTEYQETAHSARRESNEVLDLEGLRMLNNYLSYLDRQIEVQREVVFNCLEEVSEWKDKAKKAMQDRKSLEILKDKGYQEHVEEIKAQERIFNDELGLRGYVRNGSCSGYSVQNVE